MDEAWEIEQRPTLAAWIRSYAAIEGDYIGEVMARGVSFAERDAGKEDCRKARNRLRARGARFLNGGASISVGPLSSACAACATDSGSQTFYLSLACNRSCYFCFNVNQANFEAERLLKKDWQSELDAFLDGPAPVTHVGLTGGEPLLYPDEAVAFFERAHRRAPKAHLRLYTDGDFLDEALLQRLARAGLTELRLSVKPDEADAFDEAVRRLSMAKRFISQVMVEMPVAPSMVPEMKRLMRAMDDLGAFGINLLEFGYPLGDWRPFAERGFSVANPPFEVLYDYSYAGGLPLEGSELACLELVEYALDEGLGLGVHYCSLENKNRMQMFQQNTVAQLPEALWLFDGDDFFWKTAKVFDDDVPTVASRLDARGIPWAADESEPSIQFHPRALVELGDLSVVPALSINAFEPADDGMTVRELKLIPVSADCPEEVVCEMGRAIR